MKHDKGFIPFYPYLSRFKQKDRTGFTLVETLICVSIIAFLSAAVFGALTAGIKLWKKGFIVSGEEDLTMFYERVESDLKSALLMSDIKITGGEDEFVFPVLGSDGLRVIRYYFSSYEKTLYREEMDYGQYLANTEGRKKVMLRGARLCGFKYYYMRFPERILDWRNKTEENIMPRFIRIDMLWTGVSAEGRRVFKTFDFPLGNVIYEK